MSAPAPASVTRLQPWRPHVEARPAPTACYSCAARLLCFDTNRHAVTSLDFGALLSPGDPYSVVLPYTGSDHIQVIHEPVSHSAALSWFGTPCELVRVRLGLPVLGSETPRPFVLLALLPTREVENAPPLLRLGAEFLHANGANVRLSSVPCEGELIVPYG